jgi:hypothetical protein
MDDANLLEQVRVAEARLAMLAPDSRFTDAAAALGARLTEVRAREADVTHKVTLPDPWRRAVFIALGRRYGLHLHRHAGSGGRPSWSACRRPSSRACSGPSSRRSPTSS